MIAWRFHLWLNLCYFKKSKAIVLKIYPQYHHFADQPLKEFVKLFSWGSRELTGDGIHEVVKLPLKNIQRVLQDLLKVGFTQRNEVELLLNSTAYGGQHQLCICNAHTDTKPISIVLKI